MRELTREGRMSDERLAALRSKFEPYYDWSGSLRSPSNGAYGMELVHELEATRTALIAAEAQRDWLARHPSHNRVNDDTATAARIAAAEAATRKESE